MFLYRAINPFLTHFKLKPKTVLLNSSFRLNLVKCVTRNFYQNPILFKKLFVDRENQHAHAIFEARGNYCLSEAINPEDGVQVSEVEFSKICDIQSWSELSDREILDNFEKISIYSNRNEIYISDERYDKIVDELCKRCFNVSDDDLSRILRILQIFPETLTINGRNFVEMWSALDDACCERNKNWDVTKMLYMADHWYHLNLSKICKFNHIALRKIERRLKKVTPSQLVQTMFLVNLRRKAVIDMILFEINLNQCIDQLTIDEIGVMGMGYFKTQTKIRNKELVSKIYERTILELDNMSDITLVNMFKVLRYSSGIGHTNHIDRLLDAIIPRIPQFNLLTCLHIALLGTDLQKCHPKSLEVIVRKFVGDFDTARLKDMERITFVIGLHDFQTESGIEKQLCEKILNEIPKRIDEIVRHKRCLPACLHYLSLCGYHSEETIAGVLCPKFIESAYGKNLIMAREIFCLDGLTRTLLRSTYTGKQLTDKSRKVLMKMFMFDPPALNENPEKISATDRLFQSIQQHLNILYSKSVAAHILPHFDRADILLAFDSTTKQPIRLSKSTVNRTENYGEILSKEKMLTSDQLEIQNNITIVPIVIGGWNSLIRDENRPTGLLQMKLRQLKCLGFDPVLISWNEWVNLYSTDCKNEFLKKKVEEKLLLG